MPLNQDEEPLITIGIIATFVFAMATIVMFFIGGVIPGITLLALTIFIALNHEKIK